MADTTNATLVAASSVPHMYFSDGKYKQYISTPQAFYKD
jgi:hypothetical protein